MFFNNTKDVFFHFAKDTFRFIVFCFEIHRNRNIVLLFTYASL